MGLDVFARFRPLPAWFGSALCCLLALQAFPGSGSSERIPGGPAVFSVGTASPLAVSNAGGLTFDERVAYQRAIEVVYWRHRVWPSDNAGPKPRFEETISVEDLRRKVDESLRQTAALRDLYGREVSQSELLLEIERMTHTTGNPEMLNELFSALGNDGSLVAECLVRPLLAERFLRSEFARDISRHEAVRTAALAWRGAGSSAAGSPPLRHSITWSVAEDGQPPESEPVPPHQGFRVVSRSRLGALVDEIARAVPSGSEQSRIGHETVRSGLITPLEETDTDFRSWEVIESSDTHLKAQLLIWPKRAFDDWWNEERLRHSPNFTSPRPTQALPGLRQAASCTAGTWRTPATNGAPKRRGEHVSVWTGAELIVWGGVEDANESVLLKDGGRYDPATDSWTALSTAGAPSARYLVPGVWSGTELVVWSGWDGGNARTGGRYNPATNSWRPTTTSGAPVGRIFSQAVWANGKMFVWGGGSWNSSTDSLTLEGLGGRYDPATDSWSAVAASGSPALRVYFSMAWTGQKAFIWGGCTVLSGSQCGNQTNTGALYDPATNSWTSVPTTDSPVKRTSPGVAVVGSQVIVTGGYFGPSPTSSGGLFDLSTGTWRSGGIAAAPFAAARLTAVSTGEEMIIWGGVTNWSSTHTATNLGARYDPRSNQWTAVPSSGAPSARYAQGGVFTGTELLIWGGIQVGQQYGENTGGGYCLVSSGPCTAPAITRQPAGGTIQSGQPASLTVSASGTSPLTYQWFRGVRGDTSTPVQGATRATLSSGPLTETTSFWVRVSNTCGSADSASATITVFGSPMSTARAETAAIPLNGKIYVLGGFTASGNSYANAILDPSTGSWSSGADSPGGNVNGVAFGNLIYLFEFYDASWNGYRNAMDVYDPATNKWTNFSAPYQFRGGLQNTVTDGSNIYLVGGTRYCFRTADNFIDRYTPSTNSWQTKLTNIPSTPSNSTEHMPVYLNGKIYVIGGFVDKSSCGPFDFYSEVLEYTISTNSWTKRASLPVPIARGTAVSDGARVYVAGGMGPDSKALDSIWTYDPSKDSWSYFATLGTGRREAGTCFFGGKIWVFGGRDKDDKVLSSYEAFPVASLTAPVLTLLSVSEALVEISWTYTGTGHAGFRVQRRPEGGGTWETLLTTSSSVNAYQDRSVVLGTTYSYRVQVFDASGGSADSNEVRAETPCPQTGHPGDPALPAPEPSLLAASTPDVDLGGPRGRRPSPRLPLIEGDRATLFLDSHSVAPTSNGLGVAIVFDSREVRFDGIRDLFSPGLVDGTPVPDADTHDIDANPSTDSLIRLAWFDPAGSWKGAADEVDLAAIEFTLRHGPDPDSLPRIVPLSDWRPASEPGPLAGSEFATCSLDVDGNGKLEALTDGVLIVRYLLGASGDTLVSGALGPDATRTSPEQVSNFLSTLPCAGLLDPDGNRRSDALTDGLLIVRYLFGFSGTALTNGAVAPDATRKDPATILLWLQFYRPLLASLELSPPEVPGPVISQIKTTLRPTVRYTGTRSLVFSLLQSPPGMTIDAADGSLSFNAPVELEGTSQTARMKVTDGDLTTEGAMTIAVASSSPLSTRVEGSTVTVTQTGSLQGLAITLPAVAEGKSWSLAQAPASVTAATLGVSTVSESQAPPVPGGITRLTDFFRTTPVATATGEIEIKFPVLTLPAGRHIFEVLLYLHSEEALDSSGPAWIPTQYGLEVQNDGSARIRRRGLGEIGFLGIPARPQAAAAPPKPVSADRPSPAPGVTVTCEEITYSILGVPVASGQHSCRVAEDPAYKVTVRNFKDHNWEADATGPRPALEELVSWLYAARVKFTALGLPSRAAFEVVVTQLSGMAGTVEVDSPNELKLHRGSQTRSWMQGTAVHEYFHHAQFAISGDRSPRATCNSAPFLVACWGMPTGWIIEGTARWFEDELFDDLDTYREKEESPLPPILSVGLDAPGLFADQEKSEFDGWKSPYKRFGFWKLLFSGGSPRCRNTTLSDLFSTQDRLGDDSTAAGFLGRRLTQWGCTFGDGFGSKDSSSLASAVLQYQYATARKYTVSTPWGDSAMSLIDRGTTASADEGGRTDRFSVYEFDSSSILTLAPGSTEVSTAPLSVPPSVFGATSGAKPVFIRAALIPCSAPGKVGYVEFVAEGGEFWVSIASPSREFTNDPSFSTVSSEPIISRCSSQPCPSDWPLDYHVWKKVSGTARFSYGTRNADGSLSLPQLFVTIVRVPGGGSSIALKLGVEGGCAFCLDPAGANIGAGSQSGSFKITSSQPSCAWTATSNASWIQNVSPSSGTGSGSVTYTAIANTGAARSGTVTAGGQTFTVSQAAADCVFTLNPSAVSISAAGGSGSFGVDASNSACVWTATSNDPWITGVEVGGTGGSGDGVVTFRVAVNTGVARTGTISVAGKLFAVNQAAGSCSVTLDSTSASVPAAGGSGSFSISASSSCCAWEARSNVSWITGVTAAGTGSGTVRFTAGANSGAARSGTITVAGKVFTVNQSAGSGSSSEEESVSLPGNVSLVTRRISAGTFTMGSNTNVRGAFLDETPAHQVTISQPFYLGKYKVTQSQWQAIMGSNPSTECGDFGTGADVPVYCVSWEDITRPNGFLDRLNAHLTSTGQEGAGKFRLPTEAEWEMAARAGTQTRFSFGDALECEDGCTPCSLLDRYMWWCGNAPNRINAVGLKEPNGFGLHDIHGTLWEWVQDFYARYGSAAQTDPRGPASGTTRVMRAGLLNGTASYCRSAARFNETPSKHFIVGFRLARSL